LVVGNFTWPNVKKYTVRFFFLLYRYYGRAWRRMPAPKPVKLLP